MAIFIPWVIEATLICRDILDTKLTELWNLLLFLMINSLHTIYILVSVNPLPTRT